MPEAFLTREEIWHPLSVHFPIALLVFATIIKLLALVLKEQQRYIWETLGSLMLFAGG